jgi:short-subunit dehydrogenase
MSKTVLIIGASRGIGKELIDNFSIETFNTFGFARSFPISNSENPNLLHLDLMSSSLKEDFLTLTKDIAQIDYVIYNAGTIAVKPFLELTREDIASCYQVNIMSVFEVLQVCIPKMNKGSHIVFISSIGGFQGSVKFAGLSAYSTSKAALVSLTELLAEEYKDSGIAINCLCLGAVQTEMLEQAFPGYQAPHSAKEIAEFITDFTLHSGKFFHGKIIPVSISTP